MFGCSRFEDFDSESFLEDAFKTKESAAPNVISECDQRFIKDSSVISAESASVELSADFFKDLHAESFNDDFTIEETSRDNETEIIKIRDDAVDVSGASESIRKEDGNYSCRQSFESSFSFNKRVPKSGPVCHANHVSSPALYDISNHSPSCSYLMTKRRFPGPAGILPSKMFACDSPVLNSPVVKKVVKTDADTICADRCHISEDFFKSSAWLRMLEKLEIKDDNDPNSIINTINISWVKLKAMTKCLPKGKVPILIVVLKSLKKETADASATFVDKTGEIYGTIHRKLLEEYRNSFHVGTVLVLYQVSIFSPSVRKHYLNVTPKTLVRIYNNGEESDVERNVIIDIPIRDLIEVALSDVDTLAESRLSENASPTVPSTTNASSFTKSNYLNGNVPNTSTSAEENTKSRVNGDNSEKNCSEAKILAVNKGSAEFEQFSDIWDDDWFDGLDDNQIFGKHS